MNAELIILPEYNVIVSNEEIRYGETYSYVKGNQINLAVPSDKDYFKTIKKHKKIIAGILSLPIIDYNGFQDQLGIFNVVKLALEVYPFLHALNTPEWMDSNFLYRKVWIEGFNACHKLTAPTKPKRFKVEIEQVESHTVSGGLQPMNQLGTKGLTHHNISTWKIIKIL